MKYPTIIRRLKNSVLIQIGLVWIALLLVPAAVQIVEGQELTTIDNVPQALGGLR